VQHLRGVAAGLVDAAEQEYGAWPQVGVVGLKQHAEFVERLEQLTPGHQRDDRRQRREAGARNDLAVV
jgi:hypothetical protein